MKTTNDRFSLPRTASIDRYVIKLALVLILLPASVSGNTGYPTAGPQWGRDDYNTSTVWQMSDVNWSTLGYYGWAMDALTPLQKNDAYQFQWTASQALMDAVAASIKAPVYEAWVVSEPPVTVGNGTKFNGQSGTPIDFSTVSTTITRQGNGNVNDVGGAAVVLTYTPVSGLVITNPRWIQIYRGSRYGNLESPTVDNPAPTVYPFYPSWASGTLANGDVWLEDRPFALENEVEGNPVANEEYVSLLSGWQSLSNPNGGITYSVTIYGGVDWGFTYTATDLPEPSTFALLGLGTLSCLLAHYRRRQEAKA